MGFIFIAVKLFFLMDLCDTNVSSAMASFRWHWENSIYRKTSSISRTKSQSLNVSCILAQLSSLNPLKPAVELRMKM